MSVLLNPPLFNPLFYVILIELWLLALKLDGFSPLNKKKIKVKLMNNKDMKESIKYKGRCKK